MAELYSTIKSIFYKHNLSIEFMNCLINLSELQEKSDFRKLSRLHFQLNGGIETDNIEEVFEILDLFILLTDILDDIEDKDIEKWGMEYNLLVNSCTALTGIIVLELQKKDFPYKEKILYLFFNYLISATDGQHHDLTNQITSEEVYFNVVKKKSGSILALACTLGEVLATGKFRPELEKYAHYISIIAQLNNDYEDLLNKQKDLLLKKKTLPILYLLQYEDPMFNQLQDYYRSDTSEHSAIHISLNQIEESGIEVYINLIKLKYRKLSIDVLKNLYPNQEITTLEQII